MNAAMMFVHAIQRYYPILLDAFGVTIKIQVHAMKIHPMTRKTMIFINVLKRHPNHAVPSLSHQIILHITYRCTIGCVDDRDADVAVLIDVTQQTVESFNYYLLYFTYWFSENLLPETDNTNLRYILYTDEVVYSGKEPYKEYDFDFDDDEGIPLPMDDLPNDIDGADDVDFC